MSANTSITELFGISNDIDKIQNYIMYNLKSIDNITSFFIVKEIGIIKMRLRWVNSDEVFTCACIPHKLKSMATYTKTIFKNDHASFVFNELNRISDNINRIVKESVDS